MILFLALLILFIRSPWGQGIIVSRAVSYLSKQTGTEVNIDKLFLTFSGNLSLRGLYVEDLNRDTLVYSHELEVSVALIPLIKGKEINVKKVEWDGLKARVHRSAANKDFNYQFLIDAFASSDTTTTVEEPSSSPEIKIGGIYLSAFDLDYQDENAGMGASLKLGSLDLEVRTFDLEEMLFELDELAISETEIDYHLDKAMEAAEEGLEEESEEESQLPTLSVGQLSLENVFLNYNSIPDFTEAQVNIGELLLALPNANLNDQKIVLDEFAFNNSSVSLRQTAPEPMTSQTVEETESEPMVFEWPDWNVQAKEITLRNNQIVLQTANTHLTPGVFNPEWMNLQNLSIELNDISLEPGQAKLSLNELSFKERSGLELKKFALNLSIDDHELSVDDLSFASSKNALSGNLGLQYSSISDLINNLDSSIIDINLTELKLDITEASAFSPELVKNEYVQKISQKELTGNLSISGRLNELNIQDVNIEWGAQTALNASAKIRNIMDMEELQAQLDSLQFRTTKADVTQFVEEASLGVSLPENIVFNASAKGGMNHGEANLKLQTDLGDVVLLGQFSQEEIMAFEADIMVQDLQLNSLLQNEQLDTLSLSLSASGSANTMNDITAKLSTSFQKLRYNGYDFSNLELSADLNNGVGDVNLAFKDENLDLALLTSLELDTLAPKVQTKLTVKGADLYQLGVAAEDIRTAFELNASFAGNAKDFDLELGLNDGVAIYKQEAYSFGTFAVKANSAQDTLSASIQSRAIESKIGANRSINELIPVFQRELQHYLHQTETVSRDSINDDTVLKMNMVLRQTPIVSEVFLKSLERMDSVSINMDFDERNHTISAEIMAPYLQYQGSALDSLELKIDGHGDELRFLLSWAGISSGPVAIDHTKLEGEVNDGLITSRFSVIENAKTLINIGTEVDISTDTLQVHILPDTLILDSAPWTVLPQNRLLMANQFLSIRDFEMSNGDEKFSLETSMPREQADHIGATFSNFDLSTFTSLLNSEAPIISGVLNGDVVVVNPFSNYGITAELSIAELAAMEVPLGEMKLEASSVGSEKYDAELSLSGEDIGLGLTGSYAASADGGDLSLNLDMTRLNMSLIEKFSEGAIAETTGNLSAKVDISGSSKNPQYKGTLSFDKVGFLVNQLNSRFNITQDELEVNNSGVFLNDFVITDGEQNNFSLDGNIITENLNNPEFDLKLIANNFKVVNSTQEDSDLFYGQAALNANLNITGDMQIPTVRGSLKVVDGSQLTFIIPESEAELKEREGVVIFVNKKNPDDILTRVSQSESSSLAASLSGYDVETNFSIGEDSQFKIILDEATGDNLLVMGNGEFNLSLEPNGRTTLSGKYEVSGGHFEANLYNLVQRRFEITPGSSISWSGDPLDADLDVRAIYDVRTSAAPLMAVRTSSEGTAMETSYRERLPFQVFINVDGELLAPAISFNLDMPEDDRGAFSGSVYTQVQQLNNQEDEMNKQVFSLLVLGRFFPSSGSDGSNGGPATFALDNVNKVLSGQLNSYSEKIFGNAVDVGFDLNSTSRDSISGGGTQTQLGITAQKQLFNDRLIVQVGSEVDVAGSSNASQSTPIIGNISLEYLLTEDKRLRLKGFSKNKYEGVIDGQLTISGIAFIFTREFNKFKELWARQVKEEVEKGGKE